MLVGLSKPAIISETSDLCFLLSKFFRLTDKLTYLFPIHEDFFNLERPSIIFNSVTNLIIYQLTSVTNKANKKSLQSSICVIAMAKIKVMSFCHNIWNGGSNICLLTSVFCALFQELNYNSGFYNYMYNVQSCMCEEKIPGLAISKSKLRQYWSYKNLIKISCVVKIQHLSILFNNWDCRSQSAFHRNSIQWILINSICSL